MPRGGAARKLVGLITGRSWVRVPEGPFYKFYILHGPVAQLVRAPPCHGGGREFESLLGRSYLGS